MDRLREARQWVCYSVEKDDPQPHVDLALGFLMVKPPRAFCSSTSSSLIFDAAVSEILIVTQVYLSRHLPCRSSCSAAPLPLSTCCVQDLGTARLPTAVAAPFGEKIAQQSAQRE